jgi:toxin ParE1/3/4
VIRIDKREAARRDLIEHYIYLAESGGTELADRFLRQAEASFEGLGRQPLMGAPLHLEHPALTETDSPSRTTVRSRSR